MTDLRAVDIPFGHEASLQKGLRRFDEGLVPVNRLFGHLDDLLRQDCGVIGAFGSCYDIQDLCLEPCLLDMQIEFCVPDQLGRHIDPSPTQQGLDK